MHFLAKYLNSITGSITGGSVEITNRLVEIEKPLRQITNKVLRKGNYMHIYRLGLGELVVFVEATVR